MRAAVVGAGGWARASTRSKRTAGVIATTADAVNEKLRADGWRVALSDSQNPKRKYRYTWELVHNGAGWICVHTGRANEMAFEAVSNGTIPELAGYTEILREQTFGNSRFDLLLKRKGVAPASPLSGEPVARSLREARPTTSEALCYVEVKNVTLLADDGCYAFPDAVTERGRKHLLELINVVKAGHRAAMLYVIPRSDGTAFRAAREIDPSYADALQSAVSAGVEVYAWQATVSPSELYLSTAVGMITR